MTDEQKQRRAETARANGRKSKGPVTAAGKYRSSMNAISTGEHTEHHQEDLPPFFHLLSTDNRTNYLRSFQDLLRRYQPNCEFERGLIRRMAIELFLFDRQNDLTMLAGVQEMDWALDKHPESDSSEQFLLGHQRLCKQRDLLRMIDRNKRTHLSAYQNLMKLFVQSRKQIPMAPEQQTEIVAEIAVPAGQAEMEPSAASPQKSSKSLTRNGLDKPKDPVGETAISPGPIVRIPPATAFQMENEGATRKPDPLRSVTL